MLQQIFSGSFNFYDVVAYLVAVLLIIFLILPFHEWAHAFVAYLLGDKEAKTIQDRKSTRLNSSHP